MEPTWEYVVLGVGTNAMGSLREFLNQNGSVGWEVVSMASADRTLGMNETQVIMKRRRAPFAPPPNEAAGWYPDPCARHQYRWWDGLRWTESVNDDGRNAVDFPLPK